MVVDHESPDDAFDDTVQWVVEEYARVLQQRLLEDAPLLLAQTNRARADFQRRLRKRWKTALDIYDLTAKVAFEAGDNFNREHHSQARRENDLVFESLVRLHARACLVSSEVRALLVSGHPSGAMARWRTMHELAVVAFFVAERGQDVAERYLLHETVEIAKAAQQYQRIVHRVGDKPLDADPVERVLAARSALIERFGPEFDGTHGWAAATLGNRRPGFADIERAVDMDHHRGLYRMASYGVHPHARGRTLDLGMLGQGPRLLAGPSHTGLAEPGHGAVLSLSQCTSVLLATKPTLESVIQMRLLDRLEKDVRKAFLRVDEQQKREKLALISDDA